MAGNKSGKVDFWEKESPTFLDSCVFHWSVHIWLKTECVW